MKKTLALLLCAAMALSCLAGCVGRGGSASSSEGGSSAGSSSSSAASSSSGSASQPDPAVLPKLMVMSGPTGVGAAKLMADHDAREGTPVVESASVVADNQHINNALINKDADIAAIATNAAAALYAKTNGLVQVMAVNTLGVLYILEKGDSVSSLADLRGKTVYATGQGANPEYVLNHLLKENDVDPADVDIQWMTAQEVTAKMATGESGICMLPVPAATALMIKDSGVRQAISLSEAWDRLDVGALPQGCIVVRTAFLQEHPEAVANFLTAYEASISYMKDEANRDQAAELVAQYGITPNAAIARQAIPQCNLTFLQGEEMRDTLEEYYRVLFQADPAAIGGSMPYDSFYYGAD